MKQEKTFAEFVDHWKQQGYEVHVTNGFLKDLEELHKPQPLNYHFWEILSLPFELAEDLLGYLPRNKFTRWLSGWMATLAIIANRPVARKLAERRTSSKTYRIA